MAEARSGAERARHVDDGLRIDRIIAAALSIAAAIGFALAAAFAVIHLGNDGRRPQDLAARVGEPPSIRGDVVLQRDPATDIRAFTAEKRRLLDGYAWIDREHGIARIPIERAMSLTASNAAKGTSR
jgi:hypothetical protein